MLRLSFLPLDFQVKCSSCGAEYIGCENYFKYADNDGVEINCV